MSSISEVESDFGHRCQVAQALYVVDQRATDVILVDDFFAHPLSRR